MRLTKVRVVMAACYAYISVLTAWLKAYYPEQFMAAVLTMVSDEKKPLYIKACNDMGISIDVPDANISEIDFTPDADKHRILYGIRSIKGVGGSSIQDIVDNAPYESLEDAIARIPKKSFNKRIGENLIKAGAFDFLNGNRITLLNKFYEIRKERVKIDGKLAKDEEGNPIYLHLNPEEWSPAKCMEFEDETLGSHISCHTWWEDMKPGDRRTFDATIKRVKEHKQKNGKLMAFVVLHDKESGDIEGCIFASKYGPLNTLFYQRENHKVRVSGKKGDRESFIIEDARPL